jgi:hypothetical protein
MDLLEKMGTFYTGLGGLGDYLIFLSTFYDKISEKTNVIWFADDKNLITQFPVFNKIKNTLVFSDKMLFLEYSNHRLCVGTGITPPKLNYNEWKDINIFEKYGVVEFPSFVNEIETIKEEDNQVGVMLSGKSIPGKRKIITEETMKHIVTETKGKKVFIFGKETDIPEYTPKEWERKTVKMSLKEQLQWIKGMETFYSVDSWCKTWSAMCGIKTIVYDNVYESWYLSNMGGEDWGHNVFIKPWSKIEFRHQ